MKKEVEQALKGDNMAKSGICPHCGKDCGKAPAKKDENLTDEEVIESATAEELAAAGAASEVAAGDEPTEGDGEAGAQDEVAKKAEQFVAGIVESKLKDFGAAITQTLKEEFGKVSADVAQKIEGMSVKINVLGEQVTKAEDTLNGITLGEPSADRETKAVQKAESGLFDTAFSFAGFEK